MSHPASVRAFLDSLGLVTYADTFEANAIDTETLPDLTDADLKELGVAALGHRKKILAALAGLGSSEGISSDSGTGGGPPPPVTPTPEPSWPRDLSPETLPTWLAHPWAALCGESHPRVRLHWLVDTAELVVRCTVALALAEVVHAHGGRLPSSVAEAIAEHVERPTLGRWLGILRTLCTAAPAAPLVTRGLFAWSTEVLPRHFTSEGEGGTVETSLLVLRNQVAHGGGIARERAQVLVDAQLPTLVAMLSAVRDALREGTLVADGHSFVGLRPRQAEAAVRERLPADARGAWVVGDAGALPLEPLLHYGRVATVGTDGQLHARAGEGQAAQLYARGSRDRLVYTPLGTEAFHADSLDVAAFRDLFQLDRPRVAGTRAPTEGGFAWDDFLREAGQLAEEMIGRADELRRAKAWLKARDPWGSGARVGWISAGPGVGKSMLVARLAADYGAGAHRGLYYHRFRGGDARNDRRSFLRLLQAALLAWAPLAAVTTGPAGDAIDGRKLEDDVKARLEALSRLEAPNPRAPRPSFWVFVDGLDEAAGTDARLPELFRDLALPGTVWLVAGRPEGGLDAAFAQPGCEAVYPGGLPPMHAGDIRAMLLEGLGNGRYALLARDEDTGEDVRNAFVEGVVARAHGLPLYVHLLLEDLRAGHLDVRSEGKLPDGLTAYYDALVERLGISDAKRDLTQIVAILSRAAEPLDAAGLALLLARGESEDVALYLPRVEAALRAGAGLLRRAPSPDTANAWALYHQSFRDYVSASTALAGSVQEAQRDLYRAAARWGELAAPALVAVRAHLFRWGNEYALWWGGAGGVAAARGRLTDFAYLQARTEALPAKECRDLAGEYAEVLRKLGGRAANRDFSLWEAFFRERVHLLLRGADEWPANRILLQLAVEHADDSPVTQAAESWLATGACDWLWLRRVQRVPNAAPSACLRVLEGHAATVRGAFECSDGRILSWSDDGTLRAWHGTRGEPLAVMEGHTDTVRGAAALPDGRLVSWSSDGTLRIWDGASGASLATLSGHAAAVHGAMALGDGRLVSWSADGTLRIWDGATGAPLATLVGHTAPLPRPRRAAARARIDEAPRTDVHGVLALADGRLVSWGEDGTLRVWDLTTGTCVATFDGASGPIAGAALRPGGGLVWWNRYGTLWSWDGVGDEPRQLEGVSGAMVMEDGRLLTWSYEDVIGHDPLGHVLQLWDEDGVLLATFAGHRRHVRGARVLPDGRLVSWSADRTIRVWDADTGACLATLGSHGDIQTGVTVAPGGRLLAWGGEPGVEVDHSVRLWDAATGACLQTFAGHTRGVTGATVVQDGRVLTWSRDGTLRVWRPDAGPAVAAPAWDKGKVGGTLVTPGGHLLSWSSDTTLRLWDLSSGALLATFAGHTRRVTGVIVLPDGRLLSASMDETLRVWDPSSGALLLTLDGFGGMRFLYDGRSCGYRWSGVAALPDRRLMSWFDDGTVQLWDTTSGACQSTFEGHTRPVVGGTALPDGRLASWSADATVRFWDGATGAQVGALVGHDDTVLGLSVLRDGRLLTWSADRTLRLWDGSTGAPLATLTGHTELVDEATELPDGRVMSWSADGTLRLWDGVSGALLETLDRERARATHRDLYRVYQRSVAGTRVVGGIEAAHGRGCARLRGDAPAGVKADWHADGSWTARHLLPDGTLVATCDTHLAILHLLQGNRRVTIEEAEAIAGHPATSGTAVTS